jgi:hypothetical protein
MRHSLWFLVYRQVVEVWERIGYFWFWKKLGSVIRDMENFNKLSLFHERYNWLERGNEVCKNEF